MRRSELRNFVVASVIAMSACLAGRASAGPKDACFDAAEKAQSLKQSHDLLAARKQLALCVADACPDAVRHDCGGWLAEVDAATPTFSVHARDARGRDVLGARVLLDGAVVAESLGGAAMPANPGAHKLRLEAKSGAKFEAEVNLVEGQKDRVVEASFDVPLDADGNAVAAPPPPAASPKPPPPPATGTRTSTYVAAGLGVVGVAGLALATVFELTGQSAYRDLKNGCGALGECSSSAVSSAKTKLYVLAPVSFGVGVASLATGVAILALRSKSSSSTGVRFDVRPTTGGAFGSLSRSF